MTAYQRALWMAYATPEVGLFGREQDQIGVRGVLVGTSESRERNTRLRRRWISDLAAFEGWMRKLTRNPNYTVPDVVRAEMARRKLAAVTR